MKRKRAVAGGIALLLAAALLAAYWVWLPERDRMGAEQLPEECFAVAPGNYVAYQTGKDCSGYAAAYVLRHFGLAAEGPELYGRMRRVLGFMPAESVCGAIREQGHRANLRRGTLDTLKARLAGGTPLIALIRDGGDTHYVAVAGYDGEYIYLADSMGENENVRGAGGYNRRVTISEFEAVWRTGLFPAARLYILVE